MLLAAVAVVVQGESRVLRHYREEQHGDDVARMSSRIEEQQIIRKTTETGNKETIISSLFDNPGGNEFNETYHHGIGQHSDIKSEKILPKISFQTADTGESDGWNMNGKTFTNETIYYGNIETERIGEENGNGSILKTLFGESEEQDIKDYGIGNGDQIETTYYDNIDIEIIYEADQSGSITKTMFDEPEEKNVDQNYGFGSGVEMDVDSPTAPSKSPSRDSICKNCAEDSKLTDGSVCSVPEFECCSNDDCTNSNGICNHRNCIEDGYFRFTLNWIGNDDYDLFVVTPDGAEISYKNDFDPVSLGRFEDRAEQQGYGYHVENIYFPMEGGPSGVYRFYVRPYVTVESGDMWTVSVYEAGNLVVSEWGVGSSGSFFCKKDESRPTAPSPTVSPIKLPTPSPTGGTPTTKSPVLFPVRPPLGQPTKAPVRVPSPVPTPVPTISTYAPTILTEAPVPTPTPPPTAVTQPPITVPTPVPTAVTQPPVSNPAPVPVIETQPPVTEPAPAPTGVIQPPVTEPAPAPTISITQPSISEPEPTPTSVIAPPGPNNNDAPEPGPGPTDVVQPPGPDDIAPEPEPAPTSVVQPPGPTPDGFIQAPGVETLTACDATRNDECCVSSDCGDGFVCEQRSCMNTGNPRFTLLWYGDDSLDMYVITPDGDTISAKNAFDIASGGTYEQDQTDPASVGNRFQNIYFPTENSPGGIYEYLVRDKNENGMRTSWTIKSYDEDGLIYARYGSGNSESFSYFHRTGDQPERPRQAPLGCSLSNDECCINDDCASSSGDLCIQRTCMNEGSLRITLEWTGNDNLHLAIKTPTNATISSNNMFDIESGGRHESSKEATYGFNVENVYFPFAGAPVGSYGIHVDASAVEGVGADRWTIRIYEEGILAIEETGFGDFVYSYEYNSRADTPVALTEGSPRFTLHWPGESFYSLAVITPDGTQISAFAPYDADSRGVFEGSFQQLSDGNGIENAVESIYFPMEGGPPGMYTYYVSNSGGGRTDESWVVTIHVDGKSVEMKTGSGDSDLYSFQFEGLALPDNDNSKHPEADACNIASDCSLSNAICFQKKCIKQGTPQFVLSWSGQSDLSLSVATPISTILSSQKNLDIQSGGNFEKYEIMDGSDMHIENIYFAPEQGPTGTYRFHVNADNNQGDIWNVAIFVDGERIESRRGQGTSEVFFFDYARNLPVTESPDRDSPDKKPCDLACCEDSDCLFDQICASHRCIEKGTPQFVLSWEGDFDLALQVVTPAETTVSAENAIDFTSGGKFEQHLDFVKNSSIENIYFAPNDGLRGVYQYYVHSFANGGVDDTWELTIYVDGQEVRTDNGQGSSELSFFDYTGIYPTPDPTEKPILAPTLNPTTNPAMDPKVDDEVCDPFVILDGETLVATNGECCSDANCFPNESCSSRTCVDEGNPRFTLSWIGENDLDLFVVTPRGTIISYSNQTDPLTGGKFGEDYNQFDYGLHVENIYFPEVPGKLFEEYGVYSFYVRKAFATENNDKWTVGVFVDGKERLSVSGAGSSSEMKYDFSPLLL